MIELVTAGTAEIEAHLDGLVALLQATVGGGAPLGFLDPLSTADARAYLDDVMQSVNEGERIVLLALDAGRIVGTAQLEFARKQNAMHRGEVQKVTVLPEYRNRGVGRLLMEGIEAEARRAKRTLLILDTREGGYAERFYESLGWIRSGRIPGYFYDETGAMQTTVLFHKVIA